MRRCSAQIRELKCVVVAFSAGVDSTVVLKVALNAVGPENVLAATGVSPSLAARELDSVKQLCQVLNAPLELVDTAEMDDPNYAANTSERCFFCKNDLFGKLTEVAKKKGYAVVLNGANLDDTGDFRPGLNAGKKWNVRSPLIDAKLSKAEVRILAKELGLPNWEKPALACLSSRIPYGTPVTIGSLSQVEKAEGFLWDHGFTNFRVRHHGNLARVEVRTADLVRLVEEPLRSELVKFFKSLGYTYITTDLQGFRSGVGMRC